MPRRTYLVTSDEEDEDGNLCTANNRTQTKKNKGILPIGEVIYLRESSTDFQSEDDNNQDIKQEDSSKTNRKNTSLQTCVNQAIKRHHTPDISNGEYVKKTKYERQATPLCDAIMREYSKRHKITKIIGNTTEVKQILSKIKVLPENKNKELTSTPKISSQIESTLLSKNISNQNVKDNFVKSSKSSVSQSDPLCPLKHNTDMIDVQPIVSPQNSPLNDSTSSKETKTQKLMEKKKKGGRSAKTKINYHVSATDTSLTSRVTRSSKKPPKVVVEDEAGDSESYNDDSDEDPTYSPTEEILPPLTKLSNILELPKRSQSPNIITDSRKTAVPHEQIKSSSNFILTCKNRPNKEEKDIPRPEAVNLAIRLKLLVENISDALTSEASPKIENDALKLLQTTQELLKLLSTEQNCRSFLSNPQLSAEDPNRLKSQNDGYNFKHADFNKSSNSKSTDLSIHEKYAFILDYFTSFTQVFHNDEINNVIPVMSEVLMLFLDESSDSFQRKELAEATCELKIVQRENAFYSKLISSCSERFYPWFSSIINKIIKTVAVQANIITLTFFITASLLKKAPKYKKKFEDVRKGLICLLKTHYNSNSLVWKALKSPESVYLKELKMIIQMLKYFKKRQFVTIPTNEIISNFEEILPSENSTLEPSAQYSAHSNDRKELYDGTFAQLDQSVLNPTSKLSDIAMQFVETLQAERQSDSKRIEYKLDQILRIMSRNSQVQSNELKQSMKENNTKSLYGDSIAKKNASDPKANSEEDRSILAQLFERDKGGLDNLFSSYNKVTNGNQMVVKTEPADFDNVNVVGNQATGHKRSTNIVTNTNEPIQMKQEQEEPLNEEFQFATVWTDAPDNIYSLQETYEVEDNVILKSDPAVETIKMDYDT